MSIRSLLIAGAAVLFAAPGYGQGSEADAMHAARHAAYAEVGGNGFLYSLNVERPVAPHVGVRAGVSTLGFVDETTHVLFPVTASLLVEQTNPDYHVELGGGPTLVMDPRVTDVMGTAILGFRYQPVDGGLLLRLAFVPLLSASREIELVGACRTLSWLRSRLQLLNKRLPPEQPTVDS